MPTTTTTVSGQQSIPPELMPFFNQKESKKDAGDEGILQRARALTTRNYENVYGNALKTANLDGLNRVGSLSPMQLTTGTLIDKLALDPSFKDATDIYSGMTNVDQYKKYMNTFLEASLKPQLAQATENARINSVREDRGSARAGSYGGARNILAQQLANKNLQTKLADITAAGYNTAYDNAMKTQISQAQGLTDTAVKSAGVNLAHITAKAAYGDLEKATQQQQLDAQYEDVMRQQDFPMEQVGNMANILRGVPIVQTSGKTTVVTPPPSFASQLAGGAQLAFGAKQLFGS